MGLMIQQQMMLESSYSQSQSKRQNFRQEIRRKQINQIFAQKRQIIQRSQMNEEYQLAQKLQQMYMKLVSKNDLQQTLIQMGNYTALEACLSRTIQRLGQYQCDDLCRKIVYQILNVTIPSLWRRSEAHDQLRKHCLVIVSNIVADKNAPHNQLLPTISEAICTMYVSVSQWGRDIQTIQIGWIISNILFHNLDISIDGELQKPIQDILCWAEQLVLISNPDMITNMYKGLTHFFMSVDNFHCESKEAEQKKWQKIQHFQVHRLILLQNSIEYNINIQMGSSLLAIFDFIKQNSMYLESCEQTFPEQVTTKVMQIVRMGPSQKLIIHGLELVIKIVRSCDKRRQKVSQLLLKKYRSNIENNLLYQSTNIKVTVLRLIQNICAGNHRQLAIIAIKQFNIETAFTMLIHNNRDISTIIELLNLLKIQIQKTDGESGKQSLKLVQQFLSCRNDQAGFLARELLSGYNFLLQR